MLCYHISFIELLIHYLYSYCFFFIYLSAREWDPGKGVVGGGGGGVSSHSGLLSFSHSADFFLLPVPHFLGHTKRQQHFLLVSCRSSNRLVVNSNSCVCLASISQSLKPYVHLYYTIKTN